MPPPGWVLMPPPGWVLMPPPRLGPHAPPPAGSSCPRPPPGPISSSQHDRGRRDGGMAEWRDGKSSSSYMNVFQWL